MTKNIKTKKILKQVQNDKSVETGRSMTEMLGVLAIIGVLSIGGIAGYTYAMERHYTNEILNAASQRAIVIASQIATGRQVSLTEFDGQKEVAGGTFDGTVEEWDDEFGIKVTGVKESVCQKLLKATEGTDIVLAKTDGADFAEADCAGGSFLITYSNDLGKGEEGQGGALCEGVTCSGCQTCNPSDGSCVDNNSKCDTGETCFNGQCLGNECAKEDCTCSYSSSNKISSECSSDKPYCLINPETYDGKCASTAEGSSCMGDPSTCAGTDAPYCVDGGNTCSSNPTNVWCMSSSDCQTVGGYCIQAVCRSTAVGVDCYGSSDCVETDAPYCVDGKCSTSIEGAACYSKSDCGDDNYCIDNKCYSDAEGVSCNSPDSCEGTNAPYCVKSKCATTALGVGCDYSMDCVNTDAPYCVNSKCSTSMEGAVCYSKSECGSGYCIMGKCYSDAEGASCIDDSTCADSNAPYCMPTTKKCVKTPWYDSDGCGLTQELCPYSPTNQSSGETKCQWIDNKCQFWYDEETQCAINEALCSESPNRECQWYNGSCNTSWHDSNGCALTQELCSKSLDSNCQWYNGSCNTSWYSNDNGCALTQELCSKSPNYNCSWNGTACVPG